MAAKKKSAKRKSQSKTKRAKRKSIGQVRIVDLKTPKQWAAAKKFWNTLGRK